MSATATATVSDQPNHDGLITILERLRPTNTAATDLLTPDQMRLKLYGLMGEYLQSNQINEFNMCTGLLSKLKPSLGNRTKDKENTDQSGSTPNEVINSPPVVKGWGSFQSPSVEYLIHQSPADYQPPKLPSFTHELCLPNTFEGESDQPLTAFYDRFFTRSSCTTSTNSNTTLPIQPSSTSISSSSNQSSSHSSITPLGHPLSTIFGRRSCLSLYHLDPTWTFINHGAFGASFKQLLHIRNQWSVYMDRQPLTFFDRELLPLLVYTIRSVASFVHAPPTSITLHTNVTTALNILFKSFKFPRGSRILRLNLCYGAVKKMIDQIPDIEVIELIVPIPLLSRKILIDLVESALQTKGPFSLAVFDHIASNSGIKLPIAELITVCHRYAVPVMIDGAHGLGSCELNLNELNPDYYVSNGHKWLCNPKGAAFLYVAEKYQSMIKPLIISHGTGAGYCSDFIWTGCQDYSTMLTLSSAIELWNKIGLKDAISYSHQLVLEAGRMLAKKWNTELLVGQVNDDSNSPSSIESNELSANMICVRLPGPLTPGDDEHNLIQNRLHFEYRIEVPIKVLGTPPRLWIRISGMIYNEMADYERVGEVMLQIRGEEPQETSNITDQKKDDSGAAVASPPSHPVQPPHSSPPQILRPDHTQVCIPIGRESDARAYYIGLLGMSEISKPSELNGRGGLWLYAGPTLPSGQSPHANVHIGTEDLPPNYYSSTKAHIAYVVRDLSGLEAKLTAAGYACTPGVPLPGMTRSDTRDPFGNRIELIEYD